MLKMSAGTMVGREATALLSQIESEVALDRLFRLFFSDGMSRRILERVIKSCLCRPPASKDRLRFDQKGDPYSWYAIIGPNRKAGSTENLNCC
jgi:hypothetical protein